MLEISLHTTVSRMYCGIIFICGDQCLWMIYISQHSTVTTHMKLLFRYKCITLLQGDINLWVIHEYLSLTNNADSTVSPDLLGVSGVPLPLGDNGQT